MNLEEYFDRLQKLANGEKRSRPKRRQQSDNRFHGDSDYLK